MGWGLGAGGRAVDGVCMRLGERPRPPKSDRSIDGLNDRLIYRQTNPHPFSHHTPTPAPAPHTQGGHLSLLSGSYSRVYGSDELPAPGVRARAGGGGR